MVAGESQLQPLRGASCVGGVVIAVGSRGRGRGAPPWPRQGVMGRSRVRNQTETVVSGLG